MQKSVLGAGLVAVDHVFLSKMRRGTLGRYSYLGSTGGGSVSNTLCMLSLLGYKTHIFGLTGNDYPAHIVRADFSKFNVDHNCLITRGGPADFRRTRQFSHIIYLDGEHSFKEKCLRCNQSFSREFQMTSTDLSDKTQELACNVNVFALTEPTPQPKSLQ